MRTAGFCRDQLRAARGIVKREQTLDDGVGFGLLNRMDAHLEAPLLKLFLELCQTAAADRSDRTGRHT